MIQLAGLIEDALSERSARKERVYLTDGKEESLPVLIHRTRVVDQGGYAYQFSINPSFSHIDFTQFQHHRLLFTEDIGRSLPIGHARTHYGLVVRSRCATVIELMRFFRLHRKVVHDFLKQGKVFAAIGYDLFNASFWVYPELSLDDAGRVVLVQQSMLSGHITPQHVLLLRD